MDIRKIREFELIETELLFHSCFHPTLENVLIVTTVEGSVIMLDVENQETPVMLHLAKHHKGFPVRRAGFTADSLLVTASKSIKIFDLNTKKFVRKIKTESPAKIYSLLVIDRYLLCSGDDDGYFKLWDSRVNRACTMQMKACDDYISDLTVDSKRKIVLASSGEGTLTAFNVRAKKIQEPQSELFDSGFQCVRFYEKKRKAIVGTEDGVINIFNINEWGNISDRFPIRGAHSRGSGMCSVDNLEALNEDVFIAGSSDGQLKVFTLLPNRVIAYGTPHKANVDSLAVNTKTNIIASSDLNCVVIHEFSPNETLRQSGRERPNKIANTFYDGL